jgi:hypothetical protein
MIAVSPVKGVIVGEGVWVGVGVAMVVGVDDGLGVSVFCKGDKLSSPVLPDSEDDASPSASDSTLADDGGGPPNDPDSGEVAAVGLVA